jgi:stage V sporulation protein AA
MRDQVTAPPRQPLRLGDVADVLADAALGLTDLAVDTPDAVGVWKLDAMALVRTIQGRCPAESVVLLGAAFGVLVRRPVTAKPAVWRGALAFALLFVGSAMAMLWFRADANLTQVQRELARLLAGQPVGDWWMAIPYALGVGSGAALFYGLIGRRGVLPPDSKLAEYRKQAQKQQLHGAPADGGRAGG